MVDVHKDLEGPAQKAVMHNYETEIQAKALPKLIFESRITC